MKWTLHSNMIAPAVSASQSIGRAVFVSVAPKSIGSGFRVNDDRHAPEDVLQKTVVREGATLAQIAGYSALMERCVKLLEAIAKASLKRKHNPLLATALQKFHGNQAVFLALLSCTSNLLAETFSRKLAPRDIWDKPHKEGTYHRRHDEDDFDEEDFNKQFYGQSQRPAPLQPVMFSHNPQFQHKTASPFCVPPAMMPAISRAAF